MAVEATLHKPAPRQPQAQTVPQSQMGSQHHLQSQQPQQPPAPPTRSALTRYPPAGAGATPLAREDVTSQRIAEVRRWPSLLR